MRAVATLLLAPFAVLILDWALRDPCADDWEAGLAPAAFVTGAICVVVVLRISARDGRAGTPTFVASGLWLVAAATWWTGGRSTPMFLWAFASLVALVVVVPAAAVLVVATWVRPSWRRVSALAWIGAVALVPALVAVVEITDC
jgi:hypothetical protein